LIVLPKGLLSIIRRIQARRRIVKGNIRKEIKEEKRAEKVSKPKSRSKKRRR
jgi:hypothetical protein